MLEQTMGGAANDRDKSCYRMHFVSVEVGTSKIVFENLITTNFSSGVIRANPIGAIG